MSDDIIGRKVKIVDTKHPHYNETGAIDGVKQTAIGPGVKINLVDCPHGTEGCFIFRPEQIKYI